MYELQNRLVKKHIEGTLLHRPINSTLLMSLRINKSTEDGKGFVVVVIQLFGCVYFYSLRTVEFGNASEPAYTDGLFTTL